MIIKRSQIHWEKLIYGLIYPGFVGSMIYELIPQSSDQITTLTSYFTLTMTLKIMITLLYIMDYLHLYGDLEDLSRDKVARDWIYVLCDFLSSLLFFLAFVMVKLQHYGWAGALIAIVPLLFIWYKRRNRFDLYFHTPFAFICLFYMFIYGWKSPGWWFGGSAYSLRLLLLFSLASYGSYIFLYYDKYARKRDQAIYRKKKPAAKIN